MKGSWFLWLTTSTQNFGVTENITLKMSCYWNTLCVCLYGCVSVSVCLFVNSSSFTSLALLLGWQTPAHSCLRSQRGMHLGTRIQLAHRTWIVRAPKAAQQQREFQTWRRTDFLEGAEKWHFDRMTLAWFGRQLWGSAQGAGPASHGTAPWLSH